MRVFANPLSGNGYKIRLPLRQIGRECPFVDVDIFKGESRTPEFLARNVAGQTPVLELDGGSCLAESNAILWFLADDTMMRPGGPWNEAQMLRWMFFEQHRVMPTVAVARFIRRFLPTDHPLQGRLTLLQSEARDALSVLDAHLSDRRYVACDRYSVADIALFGYVHTAEEAGLRLDDTPNVARWLAAVRAEPNHLAMTDAASLAA